MNQRNDNDHNGFEKPASETPKERPLIDSILNRGAALVAISLGIKDLFITRNGPLLTKLLIVSILALVLTIAYPIISRRVHKRKRRLLIQQEQAAFVQEWQAKFDELRLLERLKEFENPNLALSIINIVQSPTSYEGVSNQGFNPIYLSDWLYCFSRRPRIPTSDIRSFRAWCEEFSMIVNRFCQDYVLKGRERLESGPTLSKDGIANFEKFWLNFNSYMKEAEEWSIGLEKRRCEVAPSDDQFHWPPYSMYSLSYRVESLRQNSAAQAPSEPQMRP
jgi:hypothetical protein